MKRFVVIIAVLAFLFALPTDSPAGSTLRCNERIIEIGDSMAEVLSACGEPLIRKVVGEQTKWKKGRRTGTATTIEVEQWIYDMGKNRFSRTLTFRGTELVNIETGDKL